VDQGKCRCLVVPCSEDLALIGEFYLTLDVVRVYITASIPVDPEIAADVPGTNVAGRVAQHNDVVTYMRNLDIT